MLQLLTHSYSGCHVYTLQVNTVYTMQVLLAVFGILEFGLCLWGSILTCAAVNCCACCAPPSRDYILGQLLLALFNTIASALSRHSLGKFPSPKCRVPPNDLSSSLPTVNLEEHTKNIIVHHHQMLHN